jgi:hypothetical protein
MSDVSRWRDSGHLERAVQSAGHINRQARTPLMPDTLP